MEHIRLLCLLQILLVTKQIPATQIITCSGGIANPCTFTTELTQPQTSAMICIGDSVRLSATALPNITYAWFVMGHNNRSYRLHILC